MEDLKKLNESVLEIMTKTRKYSDRKQYDAIMTHLSASAKALHEMMLDDVCGGE